MRPETQRAIDTMLEKLEKGSEIFGKLAVDQAKAEVEHKREYAKALPLADGTEAARKAKADVATSELYSARKIALFLPRSEAERRAFYAREWNNWRWHALPRVFFSRFVMGRLGRDRAFFDYVEGDVAAPLLRRAEHGMTALDPARNAYLQWIASGRFDTALPHAWRLENFEPIRDNIDRLKVQVASIEAALSAAAYGGTDRFNMSDIFEYISEAGCERVFDEIVRAGRPGGRVAYWNMLAHRRRPQRLATRLRTLDELKMRR